MRCFVCALFIKVLNICIIICGLTFKEKMNNNYVFLRNFKKYLNIFETILWNVADLFHKNHFKNYEILTVFSKFKLF